MPAESGKSLFGPDADRLLEPARRRGFITHGELNALLPRTEVSPDDIESIFEFLNGEGITVVDE